MRRRIFLVLGAAVFATGVGALPAAHAVIPDSGATVVPTQLDISSPSLHLVSGSDLGVTYRLGAYPTSVQGGYRLFNQPSHATVGRSDVVLAAHTAYLDQATPYASSDTWSGRDLDTGQTWQAVTTDSATNLVGLLPHAALFTTNGGQVMISRLGGPPVAIDTGATGSPVTAAGDDNGALLTWRDQAGSVHTGYVDLRSAAPAGGYPVTALPAGATGDGKPDEPHLVSVSPATLAYERADGAVVRYDRATLALQSVQPAAEGILSVATTDTGLGWESADRTVTTCAEPAGSCATMAEASALPVPTDEPPALKNLPNAGAYVAASGIVAVGQDFAISTGTTRADRAIHRLAPGSPVVGAVIDQTGPSAPFSVTLAPGRLLVDLGYERYEQSLTVTAVGAVAGPVTSVSGSETIPNIRPAVSGSRTAVLTEADPSPTVATNTLTVYDGGAVVARWTGLPYAAGNPSFSGDRLVVPELGFSLLFSVGNPSAAPVKLPAGAVVFGDRLAYVKNRDEIDLRDLSRPGSRDSVIRPADANVVLTDLQLQGDWLYYAESDYAGSLFNRTQSAVADHLAAGGSIDRTLTLPGEVDSVSGEALLEPGFVAEIGPDLAVHLIDLSDGSDDMVGRAAVPADNGYLIGASEDAVGWVGDDLQLHLLPVHGSAQTGPQLLGTESLAPVTAPVTVVLKGLVAHLASAAVPKKTVRTTYLARVDTSRPLTSWTFILRDTKGHVIEKRTGRAPRGSVTVTWTGTFRNRRYVGKASWTLTGKGPGGQLVGRDGRGTVARGTFTVRAARR